MPEGTIFLVVMKKNVLFLCTHNSCRSQVAEGFLRELFGDRFNAFSAGIEKTRVHPLAIKVMAEAGVDISGQYSKRVDELPEEEFDFVVTVCDKARESCPIPPRSGKIIHHSFEDPSRLKGDPEEVMEAFRKVRDQIKTWVEKTFSTE